MNFKKIGHDISDCIGLESVFTSRQFKGKLDTTKLSGVTIRENKSIFQRALNLVDIRSLSLNVKTL